jgi:hypothetical protein
VLLVKDDGIYLMSNGDRSGQLPVVYARGYRGGRPGVWEASRDAMGGDDMCQFLPLDNLPPEISTDPRGRVIIEVEEDVLEVFVERVEVEGPGLGG